MWHVQPAAAYGRSRQQRVDIVIPDDALNQPLVAILAGDWWRRSARASARQLAWDLAEHGQPVAVIDVRLASERGVNGVSGLSDLIHDAEAGLALARDEASLLGWEHRQVVLLGCGAGSLIAWQLALRLSSNGSPRSPLRSLILAGLTPSLQAWDNIPEEIAAILAGLTDPAVATSWPENVDWPDLLVLHGDADQAVPATVARQFYRQATDQQAPARYAVISGADHDFMTHPDHRAYHSGLDDIVAWLTGPGPRRR